MKSYILKINSFKISEISNNDFNKYSLSARDYRKLITKNDNIKKISDFIEKEQVWKEIWSDSYMKKSKYRFLKTVNITSNFLTDFSSIEYCKPENKVFPQFWDILISKDGWWDWLWESSIYNFDNSKKLDSLSSWILSITIDNSKKYYILWFLKNNHFKNFIDLNTAQGSTIRHSKKIALDYTIPFPSKNNHENPESIEKLVSLITQNIINKEEQIKLKNAQIDEFIEKELLENQKVNNYIYSFPRISEIKVETRLDTWLYEKEYKSLKKLIENYENWFYNLEKNKIITWKTPKDYVYPNNNKHKNTFLWLTPKYIKKREIQSIQYINTKNETNIKEGDLIFTWIWSWSQWHMILYKEKDLWKIYINQNCYAIKSFWNDIINSYILCFLSSNISKKIINNLTSSGSVPAIYPDSIIKIKIPNFPEEKQQEIAMQYYNKIDKNSDLNLDNYLQKEFERNSQLWIFQLNMELFELKEKLEDIIDKIIMDEKTEIDFL